MAIQATFVADFSSFYEAVERANVELKGFQNNAEKVAGTMSRMVDSFGGQKMIADAAIMARAIEELGGVSKLTATELERAGTKAAEAVAKMKLLGEQVPPALQKLADAARQTTTATSDWSGALGTLQGMLGAIGIQATIAGLIAFTQAAIAAASEVKNLAERLSITYAEVQKFQAVALESGTSMQALTSAAQTLQQKLGEGDTALAAALRQLNIAAEDLKGAGLYDEFSQIATAIARVEDPTQRAALAAAAFGKAWKEILPALKVDVKAVGDQVEQMSGSTIVFLERVTQTIEKESKKWKVLIANALNEAFNWNQLKDSVTAAVAAIKPAIAALPKPGLPTMGAAETATAERDLTEAIKERARVEQEAARERDQILKQNYQAAAEQLKLEYQLYQGNYGPAERLVLLNQLAAAEQAVTDAIGLQVMAEKDRNAIALANARTQLEIMRAEQVERAKLLELQNQSILLELKAQEAIAARRGQTVTGKDLNDPYAKVTALQGELETLRNTARPGENIAAREQDLVEQIQAASIAVAASLSRVVGAAEPAAAATVGLGQATAGAAASARGFSSAMNAIAGWAQQSAALLTDTSGGASDPRIRSLLSQGYTASEAAAIAGGYGGMITAPGASRQTALAGAMAALPPVNVTLNGVIATDKNAFHSAVSDVVMDALKTQRKFGNA
jgi:hypothetical protein